MISIHLSNQPQGQSNITEKDQKGCLSHEAKSTMAISSALHVIKRSEAEGRVNNNINTRLGQGDILRHNENYLYFLRGPLGKLLLYDTRLSCEWILSFQQLSVGMCLSSIILFICRGEKQNIAWYNVCYSKRLKEVDVCVCVMCVCVCAVQVLSVLWDVEQEEVEDVLQEFVNKSLLFRDCNQRPYLYYLHDLQLDFLTELNRTRLSVGLTLSLTLTHFLSLSLSLSL